MYFCLKKDDSLRDVAQMYKVFFYPQLPKYAIYPLSNLLGTIGCNPTINKSK